MASKRLIEKVRDAEANTVKGDEANATEIDKSRRFGSIYHELRKLVTPTIDSEYQKRYNEATGPTEKGRVLTEYLEQYTDVLSKSLWAKTALADLPHMQVSPSAPKSDPEIAKQGGIVQPSPEVSARGIPPTTDFKHSTDFRSVTLNGKLYTLTSKQAQVIEMLYEAYEHGTPELGQAYILEQLGERSTRLRDTFKRNPDAWRALVVSGARRGSFRLNLGNPAGPPQI